MKTIISLTVLALFSAIWQMQDLMILFECYTSTLTRIYFFNSHLLAIIIRSLSPALLMWTVKCVPSQLQTAMQSKKFAAIGALVGAAHLSGVALKYSKSPHGIDLIT